MPLSILSPYRATVAPHYRPETLILYSTSRGVAKSMGFLLHKELSRENPATIVDKISFYQPEELLNYRTVVLVISTQAGGTPAEDARVFHALLQELATDHRVSAAHFGALSFGVVGLGSDAYTLSEYCTPAKECDRWLSKLGARRLFPLMLVTDTADFEPQAARVLSQACRALAVTATAPAPGAASESDSQSEAPSEDEEQAIEEESKCGTGKEPAARPREMVTARQRTQLTKEGYKLIGSHSAVKLCRWTKHHLRGRGGCYKHTFYGIESGQCMEMTPSLACANKCVFCWRHQKNPVATEWKFETDPAEFVVREAVTQHLKMVKELKGVPDVKSERFEGAVAKIRHCALSLVGEPIMYPEINTLLYELHRREISSFLVTNAQFPEAIRALCPVTQLYVSVDAASPESLKAIDRPLFADYWERFVDSLKALKHKKQRTVYRLTLVKDYNMADVGQYGDLVRLGNPSFIEVKGVTYNGEEGGMSMSNVPWFQEVKTFCETLIREGGLADTYAICCEHKHSLSVLIADKKFQRPDDGQWMTWIDYDKFNKLVLTGNSEFAAQDYWAETPAWALYGAAEEGFDPKDTRVFKRHR